MTEINACALLISTLILIRHGAFRRRDGALLALCVALMLGFALCGCATTKQSAASDIALASTATTQPLSPAKKDDTIPLSREDWAILRQAQERRKAKIKQQRLDLEACAKERSIEEQRHTEKFNAMQKAQEIALREAHRHRRMVWITVGISSVMVVAAFGGGLALGIFLR